MAALLVAARLTALGAEPSRGVVNLVLHEHVHSHYTDEIAGMPARLSGGGGLPERFDHIGRRYLLVRVDPIRGTMSSIQLVEDP